MHKTPNALNIICHLKLQSAEKQATHHSVGLISVPTGRFAFATEHISAVASLSRSLNICRCRTENIRYAAGSRANRCFCAKRSANAASAKGVHSVRKRSQRSDSNSTDVGHEGVITGCDGFSLRSSFR